MWYRQGGVDAAGTAPAFPSPPKRLANRRDGRHFFAPIVSLLYHILSLLSSVPPADPDAALIDTGSPSYVTRIFLPVFIRKIIAVKA